MSERMDVDVWLRSTGQARTEPLRGVPGNAALWTDEDVRTLLTEMLLARERAQNPGGEPPLVALRGFSWIVSPDTGGVLVHLEMRMGTASAGPFAMEPAALTAMIARVIESPPATSTGSCGRTSRVRSSGRSRARIRGPAACSRPWHRSWPPRPTTSSWRRRP